MTEVQTSETSIEKQVQQEIKQEIKEVNREIAETQKKLEQLQQAKIEIQSPEHKKELTKMQKQREWINSMEFKNQLIELYKQNLSTYKIADMLGVSQSAAKKHLNEMNLYTENQQTRHQYKSEKFRNQVVTLFNKEKNITKLSKELNISPGTARKILRKVGLIVAKKEEQIKSIEQVQAETAAKIEEIAKKNVTFAKPMNPYARPVPTVVKPVEQVKEEVKTVEESKAVNIQPAPKKYSLQNIEQTQQAITTYVLAAMKECKFGNYEIQEYINECKSGDFVTLLECSQDYIDECNKRV